MNLITTFDVHKEAPLDLLRGIQLGRIQLPDFQRNWVWNNAQVCSSVPLAYLVGGVILLQLGNPPVRFKPRPVKGVRLLPLTEPGLLILNGQQRLITFFQALMTQKPLPIKDSNNRKPIRRWYYMDLHKALTYPPLDREEAILSLSEDRHYRDGTQTINWSTPEREYELGWFSLCRVFDYASWRSKYSKYWGYQVDKLALLNRFEAEVIRCFDHYHIPVIQLRQKLPKEAVCEVLQKLDTTGRDLTVFDLMSAACAADNFSQQLEQRGISPAQQLDDILRALLTDPRTLRKDDFAGILPVQNQSAARFDQPGDRQPGIRNRIARRSNFSQQQANTQGRSAYPGKVTQTASGELACRNKLNLMALRR